MIPLIGGVDGMKGSSERETLQWNAGSEFDEIIEIDTQNAYWKTTRSGKSGQCIKNEEYYRFEANEV